MCTRHFPYPLYRKCTHSTVRPLPPAVYHRKITPLPLRSDQNMPDKRLRFHKCGILPEYREPSAHRRPTLQQIIPGRFPVPPPAPRRILPPSPPPDLRQILPSTSPPSALLRYRSRFPRTCSPYSRSPPSKALQIYTIKTNLQFSSHENFYTRHHYIA